MNRKLTNEIVDARIGGRGITRIDNIQGVKHRIAWCCDICNNIWQATPDKIIRGTGCPSCARNNCTITKPMSRDQFVTSAMALHKNEYGYNNVQYINAHTKVIIDCLNHGPFSQTPTSHLSGNGCPICRNDKLRMTRNEFIHRAKIVHGNKYQYDKFEYVQSQVKGTITCAIHGDFLQRPHTHLIKKAGCRKCDVENRKGKYSEDYFKDNPDRCNVPGWLYLVRTRNVLKIGITTNLKNRLEVYPSKEVLLCEPMSIHNAFTLEQTILRELSQYRFHSKIKFDGFTECFKDTPEILDEIKRLAFRQFLKV